jgi:hypothetical protein
LSPKTKKASRKGATGRRPPPKKRKTAQKPKKSKTARKTAHKTARKASTGSAKAARKAAGQPLGTDVIASTGGYPPVFAMQGAFPDPNTHRRHSLRCLGLSTDAIDDLLRRIVPKGLSDLFVIRRLQTQDPTHNDPLRILLAMLKEAEDAARPGWQRR